MAIADDVATESKQGITSDWRKTRSVTRAKDAQFLDPTLHAIGVDESSGAINSMPGFVRLSSTRFLRNILAIGACVFILTEIVGCSDAESLSVSGLLTYQGVAVPGEITFEPIDANGKSIGRATAVTVSDRGAFRVSLPSGAAESRPFRLMVRVAPPSPTGHADAAINPAAFGAGVKTVPLLRELRDGQKLVLAVTQ